MPKPNFKPLLLTNTVRNPRRLKLDFLRILKMYDGEILTNLVIENVCKKLIKENAYKPMIVSDEVKRKRRANEDLTNEEVNQIYIDNPQNHGEAGFDHGWPSRFDTWYEFAKKLGFVNYSMNQPIAFSETGNMLVEGEDNLEQIIFANAFTKYQTNNPYTNVLNAHKPLILLLKTIQHINNDSFCNRTGSNAGLAKHEIAILLCWRNNDSEALFNMIKNLRREHGVQNVSDEVIWSICSPLLDSTRRNPASVQRDGVDEFIRKMRLTGLVTLRGGGRFLSINTQEERYIKYIVENYSDVKEYQSENSFFDDISLLDNELAQLHSSITAPIQSSREKLVEWSNILGWETIEIELKNCIKRGARSSHPILQIIDAALRFEWLISLALINRFPDIIVEPSCTVDDTGLPKGFASGVADIKVIIRNDIILLEPTLLKGVQQHQRESYSIQRHVLEEKEKNINKNISSFLISPKTFYDSKQEAAFARREKSLNIYCLDIDELIEKIKVVNNLNSLLDELINLE